MPLVLLLPNLPGHPLCVRRPHGAIQKHSLLSSRKGPAAWHGPRAPLTAAHNALVDLRRSICVDPSGLIDLR
ncbi:hypothetical protein [Microbispora bryophytorum]|uniref:hypothetical protein n=1 Tax=Microbispora bryophytorum TaxID=1460882 RepID=UPI0033F82E6A